MSNENGFTTERTDPADQMIGRYLAAEIEEPHVSPALVEQWAARAKGIEAGREAARELADKSRTLTDSQTVTLAARCVVGHILMNRMPPKGVSGEQMTAALAREEAFRSQTRVSRDRLIEDIRTGQLILRTTKAAAPAAREPAAPAKNLSDPEIPTLHSPDRNTPGL